MKTAIFYWYCPKCDKWNNEFSCWCECPICGHQPISINCVTARRHKDVSHNVEQVCNECEDRFSCWTSS
jgi:transcription elongation factor Elf1